MKRTADPGRVRLMVSKKLPETIIRQGFGNTMQPQNLGHHQKHHKASVCVQGTESKADRCCLLTPGALRLFQSRNRHGPAKGSRGQMFRSRNWRICLSITCQGEVDFAPNMRPTNPPARKVRETPLDAIE